MNVPEISEKIDELYRSVRQISRSPDEIANKINSILIYGDRVSPDILKPAWDYFAKRKGVNNE